MTVAGIPLESFIILPITILAFLVLLTIIVFIHEYGHFSVARLLGVRVDVFSIGFGKPLLRWTDRKGTEWRVARWPLGGYVKFFGDLNAASQASPEAQKGPATTQFPTPGHEDEVAQGMSAEDRKVCFHFKPVWARALIVAAGPLANFVWRWRSLRRCLQRLAAQNTPQLSDRWWKRPLLRKRVYSLGM